MTLLLNSLQEVIEDVVHRFENLHSSDLEYLLELEDIVFSRGGDHPQDSP